MNWIRTLKSTWFWLLVALLCAGQNTQITPNTIPPGTVISALMCPESNNAPALTAYAVICGPNHFPFALTVGANGAIISGSTTYSSDVRLGTLPTATFTVNLGYASETSTGCPLTNASGTTYTTLALVSISTSGTQTWSGSGGSIPAGSCVAAYQQASVDSSAANPQVTVVALK